MRKKSSRTALSSSSTLTAGRQGDTSLGLLCVANGPAYSSVRKVALEKISSLFAIMFERSDDVFFEKANKSASNLDQQVYFDAMRELRLIRNSAERLMFSQLLSYFTEFPDPDSALHIPKIEVTVDSNDLVLLEKEALEENVAFDAMVSRANSDYAELIRNLAFGINKILTDVEVTSSNLPVAPAQLCEFFRHSIEPLQCSIECRLIVFKLFEKHVLNHLPDALKSCLTTLKNHGVEAIATKQLVKKKRRQPSEGQNKNVQTQQRNALANSGDNASLAAPGFAGQGYHEEPMSLAQLLVDGALRGEKYPSSERGASYFTGDVIDRVMVLNSLSTLQRSQPSSVGTIGHDEKIASFQLSKADAIVKHCQQGGAGDAQGKLSTLDHEAINFVTLIFSHILEDSRLSHAVKVLLCRLQIPLIKVAMLDRTFFTNEFHPARKLINNMGKVGQLVVSSSIGQQDEPVYERMREVVDAVTQKFDDDVEIFVSIGETLSNFIDAEQKRASAVEKRIILAEEGKAAADRAKELGQHIIESNVGKHNIPEVIENILNVHWLKVLSFSYLRHGANSKDFRKKSDFVKHLVRSVTPPATAVEKRFSETIAEMVLTQLQEGFTSTGLDGADLDASIKVLTKAHQDSLTKFSHAATESNNASVAVSIDAEPESRAGGKHIETCEPDQSQATMVLPLGSTNDATNEAVSRLPVGTWVSISGNEHGEVDPPLRCKLAAFIKDSNRFIFVNRRGLKVLELNGQQIAALQKKEYITLIESGLVFETALENVVAGLRDAGRKE